MSMDAEAGLAVAPTEGGAVKQFYMYDQVYRFTRANRVEIGVVSASYEISDTTEEYPDLQKGQMIVVWGSAQRRQLCRQSRVRLLSRRFMPGDIVRRLQDGRETQRGYCKAVRQYTTVKIVESDKVIEGVSDARLAPIRSFQIGDAVCVDTRFGRILDIEDTIRMQTKCGSIVEICSSESHLIRDTVNPEIEPSYPGQSVVFTPMQAKELTWIKKSRLMKRRMELSHTFTIQHIEMNSVEVSWYTSSSNAIISTLTKDEMRKMKVLPSKEHSWLMEGRHLLQIRSNDVILQRTTWLLQKAKQLQSRRQSNGDVLQNELDDDWLTVHEEEEETDGGEVKIKTSLTKKRRLAPKLNKFNSGAVCAVEVICFDARAQIVWQDGTEETDIPATELYFSVSLDEHEFFPGEFVVRINDDSAECYGVIESVNFLERTAIICWFTYDKKIDKVPKMQNKSESSVYDIVKHSKFVFRPGAVVRAWPLAENQMGKVIDSLPEGFLKVEWLNGEVTNCWPQFIDLLPDYDDFDFSDYYDSCSDVSWYTESIESFNGDVDDQVTLQHLAEQVIFIRSRINHLYDIFISHNYQKECSSVPFTEYIFTLFSVYYNSRYLDKFLGTNFFNRDSHHFKSILNETKSRYSSACPKLDEQLNDINVKDLQLASLSKLMEIAANLRPEITTAINESEPCETCKLDDKNLITEMLIMLRNRLDLVYAELIARIGGKDAFTVLTDLQTNQPKIPLSNESLIQLTPDEKRTKIKLPNELLPNCESFCLIEECFGSHHYYSSEFKATDMKTFTNTLQKEYKLLNESLPHGGVWVRTYGDRMDLFSVMIRGPGKTPYEDGLFLFDLQLPSEYPSRPPLVHYIAYQSEALNPNLYVEGKVCVSLLGTWMGRDSEVWGPNSNLLQVILSIQGLILVAEPYYNEAGYEKQSNTQQGCENSRTYNEFVLLRLVQSMIELLNRPSKVFHTEIMQHIQMNGETMCERLLGYCDEKQPHQPEFSLLPVSKGFRLSLNDTLEKFKQTMAIKLHRNDDV